MGLKEKLNQIIEKEGYVSLDQIYKITQDLGHKQRTAERELNPSRSPNVFTVKNEKGFIQGYRWLGTQETAPERTFTRPITPKAQEFLQRWTKPVIKKENVLF